MDGTYQMIVGGVNSQGQYCQNTPCFGVTGSSSADEYQTATDLCQTFSAAPLGAMQALMGTDTKINILGAKLIGGAGGQTIFIVNSSVGSDMAPSLSNAVAVDCAVYPGGNLNRPGHWFFWGLSAARVLQDLISAPTITAIVAFMNMLKAGLSLADGGTATYGTYTRKTKAFTPAAHFNVRPKLTGMNKRTKPLY